MQERKETRRNTKELHTEAKAQGEQDYDSVASNCKLAEATKRNKFSFTASLQPLIGFAKRKRGVLLAKRTLFFFLQSYSRVTTELQQSDSFATVKLSQSYSKATTNIQQSYNYKLVVSNLWEEFTIKSYD